MIRISLLVFFFSVGAHAAVEQFSFPTKAVKVQASERSGFTTIEVQGFQSSRTVGSPELPVKTMLLQGTPESIQLNVDVLGTQRLANTMPMPVQAQPCRCAMDRVAKFEMNQESYRSNNSLYEMSYLGAFRGTPITSVTVKMGVYNSDSNSVDLFNNVRVSHNADEFTFERADYKDYLIVAPAALVDSVKNFVDFKKSQGFNVIVESVKTPQLTLQGIAGIISQHYKNDGTDFVLLIGDEKTLPMHSASTSGGTTPSDLYYYTMDGSDDTIPDMFFGRIAATAGADITERLAKSIEHDTKSYKDNKGMGHVIGIASNQGSNPSDNDYIQSIEQKLATTWGYQAAHF